MGKCDASGVAAYGSYSYHCALRGQSARIQIISTHPLPKHQTFNQTHVTSKMSRSQIPVTLDLNIVHVYFNVKFYTDSSFPLPIHNFFSIIKTYWLHAYSEYKILRSMDMWKVRLLPLHASRTLQGCLAGFSHQTHTRSSSPYPCALRPHSRLFHGDLQTASRNIVTG